MGRGCTQPRASFARTAVKELLVHYEALLTALGKSGIMCNPAKVHVAVRSCVFYGFNLSRKGMSPAEKNLDPVRKMTAPIDKTGVRSVLGVFNQFRSFFPRYARIVAPECTRESQQRFLRTSCADIPQNTQQLRGDLPQTPIKTRCIFLNLRFLEGFSNNYGPNETKPHK